MKQSAWLRILTLAITFLLLSTGLPGGGTPTAAAPLGGGGGQSWSIAGTGFVSADSGNSYRYQTGGGVKLTAVSGPWPFMTAAVELPDGAVINALTLYYYDSDASANIILWLQRSDRAGGVDTMAGVNSGSGSSGTSYATDNSITNGTVDNGNYHYSLSAELDSANVILYGARIDYTPPIWTATLGDREKLPAPPPDQPPAADPALVPEAGAACYTGGQVVFLATPAPDLAGTARTADMGISAGLNPLAVANPAHWQRHTIPGSTFHPINSGTGHAWSGGGGRHVTTAPPTGVPSLVAPLDLINGKIVRQVKFTYYDVSPDADPWVFLYRVDRQGNLLLLWNYEAPAVSGGYFTAVSPPMSEVVNNFDYAYYFIANLDTPPVGEDLRAMEVEVTYVLDTYLPVILRSY